MPHLLKDEIDPESIRKLAFLLKEQRSAFDIEAFEHRVLDSQWPQRKLMERIGHLSRSLHEAIELPYTESLNVLKPVSEQFSGLFHLIFSDYVARFGRSEWDLSMQALAFFTARSTAEYGLRPFLKASPERVLSQAMQWAESDHEHLRRLASEGVRPRLPWAARLGWLEKEPERLRPLIETLQADQSAYVRKSVANLINDLSKTEPDWVVDLIRHWKAKHSKGMPKETLWIAKHGLRTLLKQGHNEALELVGYAPASDQLSVALDVSREVFIGSALAIHVKLMMPDNKPDNLPLGALRLEYALYFRRKQRQPYRKVFKIAEGDYQTAHKEFEKHHSFKSLTTRKYYPGVHQIDLMVNGRVVKSGSFRLKAPSS